MAKIPHLQLKDVIEFHLIPGCREFWSGERNKDPLQQHLCIVYNKVLFVQHAVEPLLEVSAPVHCPIVVCPTWPGNADAVKCEVGPTHGLNIQAMSLIVADEVVRLIRDTRRRNKWKPAIDCANIVFEQIKGCGYVTPLL